MGRACLPRGHHHPQEEEGEEWEETGEELVVLHSQLPALEALMHCVQMNWMAILVCVYVGLSAVCSCVRT